jgi:hydroxyacid-oxoacid transhydrogenase
MSGDWWLAGVNVATAKRGAAGDLIAEHILTLLQKWSRFVPNGLSAIGYSGSDIDSLVQGTLPQKKVLDIAPRQPTPEDLAKLFEQSMKLF